MKTKAQNKVQKAIQIVQINRHWWTLGMLRTMPFIWDDPRCDTMATDGKSILINSDFVLNHSARKIAGVLVHETIHVVHRHPLRRGSRDPKLFNIACDALVNKSVLNLGYELPTKRVKETSADVTAEALYDRLKQYQEKEQQQAEQDKAEQEQDQAESGDSSTGAESSSSSTEDSDGSNNDQSGESGESGAESGESGEGAGSGESAGEGSGGFSDGSDCLDYPLEPGQTIADAHREIDQAIAKAKLSVRGEVAESWEYGAGLGNDKVIFERIESDLDWLNELSEYMNQFGGSDYSMIPPNRRLSSAGILANRLNPAGCGDVVFVVDTSGSINEVQLNLALSNLELFMENIDYTSLRIIACNTHITFDETFTVGEAMDISHMQKGGGTSFNPAFELVAEGEAPDLLIYLTDMAVPPERAPDENPGYPVLWLTDSSWVDDKTGDWKETSSEYADRYFLPDWGDIISTK